MDFTQASRGRQSSSHGELGQTGMHRTETSQHKACLPLVRFILWSCLLLLLPLLPGPAPV